VSEIMEQTVYPVHCVYYLSAIGREIINVHMTILSWDENQYMRVIPIIA